MSQVQQVEAQKASALPLTKTLKRKVAIGRFTNETRYGRTFVTDANFDPLGKQASDMLMNRLTASNRFLVFERQDLHALQKEQAILKEANLIGVDALILGSVTEFGRNTTGEVGFLSSTKVQTARAKVEIRLVDTRTGFVFFTATGSGQAASEASQIIGLGSRAEYDGTLNDRAIGAAISDVQNMLIAKLEERPWRTDILKVDGTKLYISGGSHQGIKVGNMLVIMRQGDTVKSGQTGFAITLPPEVLGRAKVTALFGNNESNEGAVAELVSGSLTTDSNQNVFITEAKD